MASLTESHPGTALPPAAGGRRPAASRRARRRRSWFLAGPLLLAAIVWFLPAIVASTPLLDWILARATAGLGGTVTVGSASLGWLSPIAARDVEVCDLEGHPVLQVPDLSGDKSLAAILRDYSKPGRFRLQRPKLTVITRDDGSNLEDLLADLLTPKEQPSNVELALEITDGSVSLTDSGSGRTWQIEQLQLSLRSWPQADETLTLEASATVPDPQRPGRLALTLNMRPHESQDRPAADSSLLAFESDGLPLEMFASLIGRFAPQVQLAGRLGCRIDAQFHDDLAAGDVAVQADLTGEGLALSAPWLGADRPQLGRLAAACHVARREGRLEVEAASLDCDLGSASALGTLELGDPQRGSLLRWLPRQRGQLEAAVDLARLAQMLPNTLRIRPGTRITSGHAQLSLSSQNPRSPGAEIPESPNPEIPAFWHGRLEVGNVQATYADRQLSWEKPILLTLAAQDGPEGPVVEDLRCQSDFFDLDAAGTLCEAAASATFDLGKLADQLGQFLDLGEIRLAGDGWTHLSWTRDEEGQFQADAELQLRDFQLAMPDQQPWTEEEVLLLASAGGRTDPGAGTQLSAGSLQIKASSDRIRAELTGPVLDLSGGTWPLDIQAQGHLQNWPARLRSWIAPAEFHPAGAYQLSAEATVSTRQIAAARARLAVEQFRLLGPSLDISEPAVELTFSGDFDLPQRRLRAEPVSLSTHSLAARADRVVLEMPKDGPLGLSASGLRYRGDLQRLRQWAADPQANPTWNVAGQIAGTAEFSHSAGLTNGQLNADLADLSIALASGRQFHEPAARLAARGQYEHRAKMLRLDQLDLVYGAWAAWTAGQVAQTEDGRDAQLAGKIQYDLDDLGELLQPYVGSGVRVVGRGLSAASYRGPLELAHAQADAGARWERAEVYGFQVGPGELKAALADGVLQAEPMNLAVNGGRLMLAPRLRLAPEPMELTLPAGPLATQVQITPAMCASALKYIAPVLADVSTAQGAFSIALDGCRIPLDEPAKGELAGRLTIHSVQVGPGPLVRELAVLLGRAVPATLRRESVVQFRMVGGRMYHQGLELIFPELTIRTYGSVGLDETLAIMAEMPVPPKWLGNNVLGSALRDQTIRLPIGGTLSQPRIDPGELDRVSAGFLERAAQNVIEDELGKQFERLFGTPR